MTKAFISYSRRDKEITREFLVEFQKDDIDCWIDWESIPIATDWREAIEKGIEEADSFLYLISSDSLHSEVCQQELNHAVKKNKRIIPVVVRELDPNDKLPDSLLNLELFRLTKKDSHNALDTLITEIHQDEDWAWMYKKLEFKASEWDINKRDKKYLLCNDEYLKVLKKFELAQTLKKKPKPTNNQIEYMQACYRANGGKIGQFLKQKTRKTPNQKSSRNVFPPGRYFISHSYGDAPIRDKIIGQLPPGMEPYIFPPITVAPHEFVSNSLIKAILSCDGVIYLRGGKSAQSFWVAFERDFALRNGKSIYAADPDTLTIERDFSEPLDLAVFASYQRRDKLRIQEIVNFMREERHFDIWLDWENIPASSDWMKEIERGLKGAIFRGGYQIVFWSQYAAQSNVIGSEIEEALKAVPNIKNSRTLFALLENEPLPEKLLSRGYNVPPVQLYEDDERLDSHRLDDLIVRLYWQMYQNKKFL